LGLHEKPILLMNTNGYWDLLIELLNHVVTQGFADNSLLDYITVVPDAAAATLALQDALA
jgi:predicted Rossmann-fold nucleotide-binding protein